jgi:copper chaperone NosL
MQRTNRILVAAAALLLAVAFIAPLWRIELQAPQYPEGLGLRIWVHQITGRTPHDLNSLNELNHYIGMRAITPESIPELRLMPWVLAGLIAGALVVALTGWRPLLYLWTGVYAIGAAAGLGDFYKWCYDYGHNLDPHAAIKVPGMNYQPPMIGVKQLLNFHAASWPALGGIAAITALGLGVVAIVRERRGRAPAGAPVHVMAGAA